MNRLIVLIITVLILNSCSSNKNSNSSKEKNLSSDDSIRKLFLEKNNFSQELNPKFKLNLVNVKINEEIVDNKNNFGFQNYDGLLNKIGDYRFSKLDDINQINYKPLFLDDGLIFFDKKGSVIRYNGNNKIIWKKNYYSKSEKKLKPKLNFIKHNEYLIVVDNIAKYYSININTGELNWIKNNTYPFNSEIKKSKNKFFTIDYNNTLHCYYIKDGSKCWDLETENTFTISSIKYSLIIIKDLVVFTNSIGDVTAADIETGLIRWQLPTQSSSIINETFNFKISKLVSDGKSIFFSNNKKQFYSIDVVTGVVNWMNEINSSIKPILTKDLIFTISNDGYLFVIEKNNGNIIRINDLFKDYNIKKRKNISPNGFVIGKSKLFLTNSDGKIIVVDISQGNILKIEKISGGIISEPFILNNHLFIVKNGSIIQYN